MLPAAAVKAWRVLAFEKRSAIEEASGRTFLSPLLFGASERPWGAVRLMARDGVADERLARKDVFLGRDGWKLHGRRRPCFHFVSRGLASSAFSGTVYHSRIPQLIYRPYFLLLKGFFMQLSHMRQSVIYFCNYDRNFCGI
jgi:hypothetical protein